MHVFIERKHVQNYLCFASIVGELSIKSSQMTGELVVGSSLISGELLIVSSPHWPSSCSAGLGHLAEKSLRLGEFQI